MFGSATRHGAVWVPPLGLAQACGFAVITSRNWTPTRFTRTQTQSQRHFCALQMRSKSASSAMPRATARKQRAVAVASRSLRLP
jgi:hypothetical protein